MMCFHSHDIRCNLVLPIISLIISSNILFCPNAVQVYNKEHSSITLYQGTDKYDLDAKDCPVGAALNQPERFSCACINGIWAFYENPCHEPIAIVGGNNHCFQMPRKPIRMAVAISNPLRAMGEFLTVFEENMDGIRSKVYRNMRLRLTDADKFITLNASWTLTSPDGAKSICLESKKVMFEGLTSEEATAFPGASYCSYSDLSDEMPFIGGVKKGCNSSMVMEPVQCQPMLPNLGDEICLSDQILKEYQEAVVSYEVAYNELDEDNTTHIRPSRSLKNLGRFLENIEPNIPVTEEPLEMTEKLARAYKGEPEWHRRLTASLDINTTLLTDNIITRQYSSNQAELKKSDLEKVWKNPRSFLLTPTSNSSHLVVNHLWMFRRVEIRDALNISRLVPPEDDSTIQVDTGKVKKLLGVHRNIMKRICPLVSSSFFDTVAGTFLSVLTQGYRWKEPYVEQTHYLRILTSLSLCKNKAVKMKFTQSSQCRFENTTHIVLPSTEGNETVNVQLDIPIVFRTGNFEPVVEGVWKMFVTVHSYCYKDFRGQYQDHHKYTNLMMGLFTNKMHDIWIRNKTVGIEYAGILGNIAETMSGLERCATGARMTSEYPFHLNRPTILSKYQSDSEMDSQRRKKRSALDMPKLNSGDYSATFTDTKSAEDEKMARTKLLRRVKRLTVNSVNSETQIGDTIFNGLGVCLKKYSDQKTAVGSLCRKRSINP